MSAPRDFYPNYIASYVFLIKDGQVLLMKRQNTGYKDGMYCVPAGHKEALESPTAAAIRETAEEVGVQIDPKYLHFVHAGHRIEDREYCDFFFVCNKWVGEPTNTEPHKCSELLWASIQTLPSNTIPYIADAIQAFINSIWFSQR